MTTRTIDDRKRHNIINCRKRWRLPVTDIDGDRYSDINDDRYCDTNGDRICDTNGDNYYSTQ